MYDLKYQGIQDCIVFCVLNFEFGSKLFLQCILYCRFHLAQPTIRSGVKQCTHSLAKSGSIFMEGHCGVLGSCKVWLPSERG